MGVQPLQVNICFHIRYWRSTPQRLTVQEETQDTASDKALLRQRAYQISEPYKCTRLLTCMSSFFQAPPWDESPMSAWGFTWAMISFKSCTHTQTLISRYLINSDHSKSDDSLEWQLATDKDSYSQPATLRTVRGTIFRSIPASLLRSLPKSQPMQLH